MTALTQSHVVSQWQIRLEAPGDAAAVEALNAEGFGPGRFAKSVYRLREGVAPVSALSFVAVDFDVSGREVLRGSVRFWPIRVGGHEELLLGPLAVQSAQRGREPWRWRPIQRRRGKRRRMGRQWKVRLVVAPPLRYSSSSASL